MTPAAATLKREQAKAAREALEAMLAQHLRAEGIAFVREREFWPGRKWRLDFTIDPPSTRLAVEVQGGVFSSGRHARGQGITNDAEKFAHAVIAGWRVMPVTGEQVKSGLALQWIKAALECST